MLSICSGLPVESKYSFQLTWHRTFQGISFVDQVLCIIVYSIYQAPKDDFERMALTTFLAADRTGRGYLTAEEFLALLRAPELNLQLSDEEVSLPAKFLVSWCDRSITSLS